MPKENNNEINKPNKVVIKGLNPAMIKGTRKAVKHDLKEFKGGKQKFNNKSMMKNNKSMRGMGRR